ncbi:MAG: YkgJ family cysteine cluster protein [Lachnospiraceae bacterium]|jgi:Fe-S-cluster containining protein|nr:YkgJ family cysteine cluster protein [Lachnospiraceae bacterium]
MKREVSLEDLKKLYSSNDMVKADCQGCPGCSDCCQGMGESIILDPFDVYRLRKNLNVSFEELLDGQIELNVVDGVILPNLKMDVEREACTFLDAGGRCSIHSFRPGLCRLFPLGRYYEKEGFRYFLQRGECPKANKSKVKVSKWLDMPNLKQYEGYINRWHYFLDKVESLFEEAGDEQLKRDLNMYLLEQFFIKSYSGEKEFYAEFEERIIQAEKLLSVLKTTEGEKRR